MSWEITKTMEVGDIRSDSTIVFKGEKPPEKLKMSVEKSLKNTIMSLMDGRRLEWEKRDKGWVLTFIDGVPEKRLIQKNMRELVLPSYRTLEDLEEENGGLNDELDQNWNYEKLSRKQYLFYKI